MEKKKWEGRKVSLGRYASSTPSQSFLAFIKNFLNKELLWVLPIFMTYLYVYREHAIYVNDSIT